ncbi:hypothetical protein [Pandoraea cepalis]|uniref:hypothetical protein n=1 Tax=Pandoraea cepalis TaxID=2508294 RepID=UPI00263B36D8|nr:hypothetical protein [Pandoraea cepalis]
MLVLVLNFSRYGLDFTDESFYLASIAHPDAYALNIPVSLFGFVYHPIFSLLRGDIGALRQANILTTFSLGWALSFVIIRQAFAGSQRSAAQYALLALGLAPMSLISLSAWLITPNYNALTFEALMLAVTGLLLLDEPQARLVRIGVALVALGGLLTFAAKPTSAAILAVIFVVYSAFRGARHLRRMAVAGVLAFAMLLALAVWIDGSPVAFVERLRRSADALRALGSGQELSKIFRIDAPDYTASTYMIAALAASVVTLVGIGMARGGRLIRAGGVAVCAGIACVAIWLSVDGWHTGNQPNSAIFAISCACVLGAVVARGGQGFSSVPHRQLWLAVVLCMLPHVAAFGTNNNYWHSGATVAFFWGLAAVVACAAIASVTQRYLMLLPFVFVMQICAAVVIDNAISSPYRQPQSLRLNTASFEFPGGGRLVFAEDYRAYLTDAITQARSGGLTAGTPMIDLTGRSPGVLYALQTRMLGQPWLVGAYPGSDLLAMTSLDTVDCDDIGRAWLLDEPGGPRNLSVRSVLAHFGADPDRDYVRVGELMTPPGAGGHPLSYRQYLLKPTRLPSAASAACLASRASLSARLKENNK